MTVFFAALGIGEAARMGEITYQLVQEFVHPYYETKLPATSWEKSVQVSAILPDPTRCVGYSRQQFARHAEAFNQKELPPVHKTALAFSLARISCHVRRTEQNPPLTVHEVNELTPPESNICFQLIFVGRYKQHICQIKNVFHPEITPSFLLILTYVVLSFLRLTFFLQNPFRVGPIYWAEWNNRCHLAA